MQNREWAPGLDARSHSQMQSVGPWVWTPGAAVYRRPADFGGREGRHPSPPLDAGAVQRRGHGRSTVQGRRSRSMVAQTFTAPTPRIDSRRLILVPITGAAVRIAMPHVSPCAVAPCRYSRAHGLIHTIARKRRRARIVSGLGAALLIRFANRSALGDIS